MMRNTTMLIREHLCSDESHFRQGDDGNGARSSNSDAPAFSWYIGDIGARWGNFGVILG